MTSAFSGESSSFSDVSSAVFLGDSLAAPVAKTVAEEETPAPKKAKPVVAKFFARVDNPLLAAILEERFRFDAEIHAQSRLKQVRKQYTCILADDNALTLWIKGFGITPTLDRQGYVGNYAHIYVKNLGEKGFTLAAECVVLPLVEHPQRKKPTHKHPNWAHPIMQNVRKKKIYQTLDSANVVLEALHREFPDTTIPASENRLYVHLYTKEKGRELPIQKIVLKAVAIDETGERIPWDASDEIKSLAMYRIDWKENTGRSKKGGGGMKADAAAMAMASASMGR